LVVSIHPSDTTPGFFRIANNFVREKVLSVILVLQSLKILLADDISRLGAPGLFGTTLSVGARGNVGPLSF
jgi:hypothetical protein